MRKKQEIVDKIGRELERLEHDKGHARAVTQGWIDALEWVIEDDI